MKKYLLVLLAVVMMIPSMVSAAEHKVVPTFKLQKTTQTMEGIKMSFPRLSSTRMPRLCIPLTPRWPRC
jgi:hypothetical protein